MENNGTFVGIPEIVLAGSHNNRKMPLLGMGTAASPPLPAEQIKRAVLEAIELGYRHFDTASLYLTEEPLGQAIAEALSIGLIKSRDELFITSKLWCSDAHSNFVLPALQKTLRNLQLEYIDLYLIHWPVSSRPGIYEFPIKAEDFLAMDFKGVWAAMEECQQMLLTKSIGVSNFSWKKLSDILGFAKIPPAVNQVEINPLWNQKKLIELCKANGVVLTAYAALGAKGTIWGSNRILENDVLSAIASAKGKTVAQICLRWAYEQGVCVLVKSFNKERMKRNLDIFNWTLSEDELNKISDLPQSRGCRGENYISSRGPFRTVQELWDSEI